MYFNFLRLNFARFIWEIASSKALKYDLQHRLNQNLDNFLLRLAKKFEYQVPKRPTKYEIIIFI